MWHFFFYPRKPRASRTSLPLVVQVSTGMNGSLLVAYEVCDDSPMRIQHLNHSTYQHQYHIIWGTKYRRKILKPYVFKELKTKLYDVCKKYPTLWIESMNVDDDHIHLQIEIPPNIAVADAVGKLKAESSRYLRSKFKFIRELYLEKDGIWSVGYFTSTVGLNEVQVKKYIAWQGKRDLPQKSRLF